MRVPEDERRMQLELREKIDLKKQLDAVIADNARLQELEAEVARLRELLTDAADDLADWGSYAPEYIQHKERLKECIGRYRKALEETE